MAEVLEAPMNVTVASAQAFAATLADALAGHEPVVLDLAPLEQVDLALVQLVTAARRQAERDGITFRLHRPATETVRQLLRRAGFLDHPAASDLAFWLHETQSR